MRAGDWEGVSQAFAGTSYKKAESLNAQHPTPNAQPTHTEFFECGLRVSERRQSERSCEEC